MSIKQTAKKSNKHKQRLLLARRKTVIVRMRSDRIVKTVNVSKKTVIELSQGFIAAPVGFLFFQIFEKAFRNSIIVRMPFSGKD